MKVVEYHYRMLHSQTPPSPGRLWDLQVDSWEFVQVLYCPTQKTFYTYLRRAKASDDAQDG